VDLSKSNPDQVVISPFLNLGRFAPFQYERSLYETRIRIFKWRCLAWTLALLLSAWFFSVCAVFYNLTQLRGITDVQFINVAGLPFTAKAFQRDKAEYYLRQGHELFDKHDYARSFNSLRAGLRQIPEDNQARRNVVELYLALRRTDLALPLIIDGLAYADRQPEYLSWVFASLLRLQEDDLVVELATKFLHELPHADPNTRHAAIMAEATAHHLRGRFAAAEATLSRENTRQTQDGLLLLARNSRDQNRPEDALRYLREAMRRYPAASEPYSELLTELKRQGRADELRRLILQRQIARPDDLRPLLDELRRLYLLNEESSAATLEASIWNRFSSDDAALDQLSLLASQTGRYPLARKVLEHKRAQGADLITPVTGLVEALLAAGRYEEALTEIRAFHQAEQESGFLALEALARQGLKQDVSARGLVLRYMDQIRLRADLLVILMQRLEAMGAEDLAALVGEHILRHDPLFKPFLENRIHHAIATNEWEKIIPYVSSYVSTRRPSRELIENAKTSLDSDRHFFIPGRHEALGKLAAFDL
jgi:hypothetical protein